MARPRKETMLDRINKVRHAQMQADLGLGMTPDEAAEALAIATQVIEELLHRRYLAASALDMTRYVSRNAEITEPEGEA